jgi:hypothetical protein
MSLVIDISCTGSRTRKQIVLNDGETLHVGRTNSQASLMVDALLSRKHFDIRFVDGRIEITHLSTTNPTLVASQGSDDFQKVKNSRLETGGCRIIAGSHRFLLTVTQHDLESSVGSSEELLPTENPPDSHSEIWSGIDSEPAQTPGDPAQPVEPVSQKPRARKPAVTTPISPPESLHEPATQATPFFDPNNSLPEGVKSQKKKSEPQKKPVPKAKPQTKKLHFPVGDDFFDD